MSICEPDQVEELEPSQVSSPPENAVTRLCPEDRCRAGCWRAPQQETTRERARRRAQDEGSPQAGASWSRTESWSRVR